MNTVDSPRAFMTAHFFVQPTAGGGVAIHSQSATRLQMSGFDASAFWYLIDGLDAADSADATILDSVIEACLDSQGA